MESSGCSGIGGTGEKTGFSESGNNFRKLWRNGLDISENYPILLPVRHTTLTRGTTQHTRGIDDDDSKN